MARLPLGPVRRISQTHRRLLGERLLTQGVESLSDIDLLTVALGSAHLARVLRCAIDRWQGVTAADLANLPRFRPARIAQILATLELGRRVSSAPIVRGQPLHRGEAAVQAYRPRLSHLHQEVFIAVGLAARRRVLAEHEIARGTLTSIEVHPREVFRASIREGAAAAICWHNHPRGDPPTER